MLDPLSLGCCFVVHTHHGVCPVVKKKKREGAALPVFVTPVCAALLSLALSPSLSLILSNTHTNPHPTLKHT